MTEGTKSPEEQMLDVTKMYEEIQLMQFKLGFEKLRMTVSAVIKSPEGFAMELWKGYIASKKNARLWTAEELGATAAPRASTEVVPADSNAAEHEKVVAQLKDELARNTAAHQAEATALNSQLSTAEEQHGKLLTELRGELAASQRKLSAVQASTSRADTEQAQLAQFGPELAAHAAELQVMRFALGFDRMQLLFSDSWRHKTLRRALRVWSCEPGPLLLPSSQELGKAAGNAMRLLRFRYGIDKLWRLLHQRQLHWMGLGMSGFRACVLSGVLCGDERARLRHVQAGAPRGHAEAPSLPSMPAMPDVMENVSEMLPEMPWSTPKKKRPDQHSVPEGSSQGQPEEDSGGMFGSFLGKFGGKSKQQPSEQPSGGCCACAEAAAAVEQLQKELAEVRADKGQGKEEVDRLQMDVERLVLEHAEERSKSREAHERMAGELADSQQALAVKLALVAELEAKASDGSLEAAEAEVAELKEAVKALEQQLETVRLEKDSMVQAMAQAATRVSDVEKALVLQTEELARLQAAGSAAGSSLEELQKDLAGKCALVEELRAELIGASKDRESMHGDREQEMAQMATLRTELQQLREETERLQGVEAVVEALRQDGEAVKREKETMAQAIVKATALVAHEKRMTRQRFGDEMRQHVAAQLYCRLREWGMRARSKYLMEWWTITAVAGVVAAVKGISEDSGNSPAATAEAVLLHEPQELPELCEDEEQEIEGESFLNKLRWLHQEKDVATDEENYVRAARMKARIDKIQSLLKQQMEEHLAAMELSAPEPEEPPVATPEEQILSGMMSLQEAISANSVAGAEAALGRGQFEMGLEDAPAVAAALQRWSVSRDVAWRACAVLASVAGDHGVQGSQCVKEAGGVGVIAVAMGQHPADAVVQANALNALRWVAASGSLEEKTEVAKQLALVQSAMALHIEDKWVSSHGEALLVAIADIPAQECKPLEMPTQVEIAAN